MGTERIRLKVKLLIKNSMRYVNFEIVKYLMLVLKLSKYNSFNLLLVNLSLMRISIKL